MSCPHCGFTHSVKNGKTKAKRQKYMCMDCNKSFSYTTNSIVYRSKQFYATWIKYIDCLIKGYTLKDEATTINVTQSTAFTCRYKPYKSIAAVKKLIVLSVIIQID